MPNQRSLVDYFPQEIIDKILDNFRIGPNETYDRFQDDRDSDSEFHGRMRALQACALVCRAFTPRCQYHLFSTVELHDLEDEGERERREGVYQMMLAKPHVADGVRQVAVYFGENDIESAFDEEDSTPGLLLFFRERPITSIKLNGGAWIAPDDMMDVGEDDEDAEDEGEEDEEMDDGEEDGDEEMESGEEGDDDNKDNNETVHTSPHDAEKYFIRPFIQKAFITSLDIAVTTLRPSLLSCFPNLVKLTLFVEELDPTANNRQITAQESHAQLRVLNLSDLSNVVVEDILGLGTPSPIFDLSYLRALDASLFPAERNALMLGLVFDACAQSLEVLKLCGEGFDDAEASWKIYDLSHFSKLTTLHLAVHFVVKYDPWNVPNPFLSHCRFLATIQAPNKMEDITMEISVACLETISPLHCLNNVPGWDDLDYQFARILSGSSGETLELNLHIKWAIVRRGVDLDKNPIALITKEARRENTMDILRSTFTQAMRKTLRRVGQDSRINLKITYGRCYID